MKFYLVWGAGCYTHWTSCNSSARSRLEGNGICTGFAGKKGLIIYTCCFLFLPPSPSELRQRHVTSRPPVPVTPNLAVAARPPPGPTAPTALISAPGGPPERNLSSTSQHHNLPRRNATPTGSPFPGVAEWYTRLVLCFVIKSWGSLKQH